MSIVILSVGTVLAVVFIALLFRGSKNDYLIEPLDSDAFPLKFLYSVGFALQDTKFARLRGRLGNQLRDDATLFYGRKYGEFYARAIWAQTLSIALAAATLLFLLAGISGADACGFLTVTGVVLAAAAAYYFLTYTAGKLSERRKRCEEELPNAISKLALLVNSGTTLYMAWKIVAFGKEGMLYDLMRRTCESMDNGKSEIDAMYEFGALSGAPEVKKFISALIQSLERGGGELPIFLGNQSTELWSQHRQRLLQKGEQAAGALLMPITLMFVGVILIILAAAMQSFSF